MEYDVKATMESIKFAPTELEEIFQNVRTIISTVTGSAPLARSFGIQTTAVDSPMGTTKALIAAEIIEAVEKYEPRVKVVEVLWSGSAMDGKITPIVRIKPNELA